MDARELQSLRNLGGICEDAADEIERLRLDAARYRWLRTQSNDIACVFSQVKPGYMVALDCFRHGPELDAAIDAAMKG